MKRIFCILSIFMMIFLCGCEQENAKVGETVTTKSLEMTLIDFRFTEEGVSFVDKEAFFCLPIEDFDDGFDKSNLDDITKLLYETYLVRTSDTEAVVWMEFTLKNIGDEVLRYPVIPNIKYGENDVYEINGGVYFEDDGVCYSEKTNGEWELGSYMIHAAGDEKRFRAFCKVPAEVQNNMEAPLYVQLSLPDGDGDPKLCVYEIR